MADRHEQEAAELVETVAKQVEEAVDGVLQEMASDFAEKTDEINEAVNGAV